MKKLLISFLIPFGFCFSHDLWIEKEDSQYILYYGHLHPTQNEERFIKYNPENVLEFECLRSDGKVIRKKFEESYPAKLKGSCSVVLALFSSGFWTKTINGLKNLPKDEVQGALESWLSYESVKRIDNWSEDLKKPLTQDIEIVSLEDPLRTKVGDKLTLVVYYKGKPLKDIAVAYDEHTIGTTDNEGRINVRIRKNGLQLISTSIKEKADGVKADYVIKTAILSFEVK
ncbi:DUF4198 domain-containing protein [Sulfurihydrogenibium sp.]|uniref:DUF4198 domain-containing protein n=1 Tax=Sulfurihydrogenibium sp. TaxID=2053621 RepID=UPI00260EBFDD|nr:DUF4198 domain-containing protein [Sulfurihydrogenibium sp.]